MNDRWQQIEQVYNSTQEREESQRAAYLREVCAGDDALRREVESLLAQEERGAGFLESPAQEVAARAMAIDSRQQLGSYKIVFLLGAGGVGEVYQAHDTKLGREEAQRFPNDLLVYKGLKWATSSGFQFWDFAAFDRSMALTILNGKSFTAEQVKSRYMFLARMGGSPRLLPETRVYFANPIFRLFYRVMFKKKIRQAEENCRLGDEPKASEMPE